MDPKSVAHLEPAWFEMPDPSRVSFEQWMRERKGPKVDLKKSPNTGGYYDNRVAAKWSAWQAAVKWKEAQCQC